MARNIHAQRHSAYRAAEIVLREAAPSGLGESDRLRRWLDAIEPQRGQIAIHVHLSEALAALNFGCNTDQFFLKSLRYLTS